MGCSKSIACNPAKIPHFFESLKILAFYAILPSTPLIACESFMEALLSGFQRVVCRLARPSNRWLKRPTPHAPRGSPPTFKSSTPEKSFGLLRLRLFAPGVKGNADFRFGNKNCALPLFFFPKRKGKEGVWSLQKMEMFHVEQCFNVHALAGN